MLRTDATYLQTNSDPWHVDSVCRLLSHGAPILLSDHAEAQHSVFRRGRYIIAYLLLASFLLLLGSEPSRALSNSGAWLPIPTKPMKQTSNRKIRKKKSEKIRKRILIP